VIRSVDPAWYIRGGAVVFVARIKVSYPNKVAFLVQKGN
jgi:hypothetical protein